MPRTARCERVPCDILAVSTRVSIYPEAARSGLNCQTDARTRFTCLLTTWWTCALVDSDVRLRQNSSSVVACGIRASERFAQITPRPESLCNQSTRWVSTSEHVALARRRKTHRRLTSHGTAGTRGRRTVACVFFRKHCVGWDMNAQ